MGQVFGQAARHVGMDVVVNGLLADAQTLAPQHPSHLGRGPVLIEYHPFHTPPQFCALAVVALHAVFTAVTLLLRPQPYI